MTLTRNSPMKRSRIRAKRKKSRVTKDGRVILTGAEMAAVRMEVFERSGGQCEGRREVSSFGGWWKYKGRCTARITWETFHLHHRKNRKMGGGSRDDRAGNLLALCADCHRLEHVPAKVVPKKAGRT